MSAEDKRRGKLMAAGAVLSVAAVSGTLVLVDQYVEPLNSGVKAISNLSPEWAGLTWAGVGVLGLLSALAISALIYKSYRLYNSDTGVSDNQALKVLVSNLSKFVDKLQGMYLQVHPFISEFRFACKTLEAFANHKSLPQPDGEFFPLYGGSGYFFCNTPDMDSWSDKQRIKNLFFEKHAWRKQVQKRTLLEFINSVPGYRDCLEELKNMLAELAPYVDAESVESTDSPRPIKVGA